MDLETCRRYMDENDLKCVVADEEKIVYQSDAKGIIPMLELLELYEKNDIHPVYQADRIMGKAAMIIAVHCGIRQIYSDVVSKTAFRIAENNNITVRYGDLVDRILDPTRSKEGPFEAALHHIDENDFEKSLQTIRETLEKIKVTQRK